MATLADLQTRIAAVRSKERRVILVSGLCRALVTLIGVALAYFVVDWVFELPYGARLLAAGAGLAAVGFVVFKYLIRELERIQDDDEIALRVESRNPDLRGRLISTLQLTRTGKTGEYVGSPELIAALEDETVRMSEPLDFFRIINTEMLVKFGVAAATIVLVKAALVYQFPDHFAALGARLMHANARFPTKTKIKEIRIAGRRAEEQPNVPRGEDLPVLVTLEASGEMPQRGQPLAAHFLSVARETSIPVDLKREDRLVFKAVLNKALEDCDVVVHIGDARSDPIRVRVLPRPEVDVNASGDCIRYKLPEYTHEKDPAPEKFGGLSALAGSTASLRFRPTKPLTSAKIERGDGAAFTFEKKIEKVQTKDKEGKPVENQIEWWELPSFPLDKTGSFHVRLLDTDGLLNSQPPVEYPIDARPDNPPAIKLVKPIRDLTITPMAKLNVMFSARDDWGMRTIWVVYRVQPEGQSEGAGELKRIERPVPKEKGLPPKIIDPTPFVWDVSALKVRVGDQIVFWLEADDDCATNDNLPSRWRRPGETAAPADPQNPPKNYSRSSDIKLTVISREEKVAELQAELERLYQLLLHAKENQEELKTKVRVLLEEIQKLLKE